MSKQMKRFLVAALAITAWIASLPVRAQDPPAHIPVAHGTTLAGTAVVLPDALKGKPAVLVLGFSHASQGQVESWGKRLGTDFGHSADVNYYEMPMLGDAPKLLRRMIIGSMGSSVPETGRSHFLPLTEDDKPWRTVAHYGKPDDAYVLVVDGTGAVRWQTQGDATDTAYGAVEKELAKVTPQAKAP
jgi:hypothetical protein